MFTYFFHSIYINKASLKELKDSKCMYDIEYKIKIADS